LSRARDPPIRGKRVAHRSTKHMSCLRLDHFRNCRRSWIFFGSIAEYNMRPCILNKRRVPGLFSRAGAPAALVGGEVVEKAVVAAGALEIVPAAAAVRPAQGCDEFHNFEASLNTGLDLPKSYGLRATRGWA
jgi:hypothetical protein